MTTALLDQRAEESIINPADIRRSRIIGIVLLFMGGLVLTVFALGSEGSAVLRLVRPQDRFADFPDLIVPAAGTGFLVAAALAGLGAYQIARGRGAKANLMLGLGMVLFIFAFLAWAAAGKSFSLVGMLQASVASAVPIAIGALSGIMCERVAVINIGIEGMLLGGAFAGAVVGSITGSILLGAVVVGGLLAALLAVLAVKFRVDQIIAGVVINFLVVGLTSFLTAQILVERTELNNAGIFKAVNIPLLADIPLLGPVLFQHTIIVYGMFILVGAATFGLFRTRWGLRSRAVGEHPKAADTLGINVYRLRYLNVILGGMIAGFGGAWFTIGTVGRFDEEMTGGRGFIGLAAMIFGRWHPVGGLLAALLFGFASALEGKLAILQTPIPSEFLGMTPYIATIVVVAGVVGKSRPPAADGQPYIKE